MQVCNNALCFPVLIACLGKSGGGSSRGGGRREESPEVQFSKTLSYLLRHGAEKEGLKMRSDGFVLVSDILNVPSLRGKLSGSFSACLIGVGKTVEDIRKTVETNDKKRFALAEEHGNLYIRANQGHTIEVCISFFAPSHALIV